MDTQPSRDSSYNEDDSQKNIAAPSPEHKPALAEISPPVQSPGHQERVPILQNDAEEARNSKVDQLVLDNLKERQCSESSNYFDYLNTAFDAYVLDDPTINEDDGDKELINKGKFETHAPTSDTDEGWNNPVVKSPKEAVVILLTLLFEAWLIGLFDVPTPVNEAPVVAEVHSPLQAEIEQLLTEINALKTTLDSHRSELNGHVQKHNAPSVKRWQYITNEHLFAGAQLTQAEQDLSTAHGHIQTGYLEQAHVTLLSVKTNYSYLVDQFEAAGKVYPAEKSASQANRKWFQRKHYYSLDDTEYVAPALASENMAQVMEVGADFSLAESYWLLAEQLWKLSYLAVADRAAEIDGWLAKQQAKKQKAEEEARQAELARQAEIQREQELAAAEAQRLAAIAEAQKLAEIEAETRRKEEIKNQRLVTLAVGRMIDIPAGSYRMGCNGGETCPADQQPSREVSIKAFRMGEAEVTFEQWDACVELGGCNHRPEDDGWGRENRPVIRVNFEDITQQFIPTLNKYSGRTFRLPTEAEWEYAARGGATTQYAWGEELEQDLANCAKCSSTEDFKRTTEIKSFIPNAFGLYDVHGNVWEWTQDCWKPSYKGSSSDGSAYLGAKDKDELWIYNECQKRVLRGGSWDFSKSFQGLDRRNWNPVDTRSNSYGFRLVEDI